MVLETGGGDNVELDRTAAWGRGFSLFPTPDAEQPLMGSNVMGCGRGWE